MERQDEEDNIVGKKFSFMIQAIQGAMPDGTLKDFAKLKSNSEKFEFVWKLKQVHDVLDLEKEYEKKSLKQAKKYRELGNDYFQKKSYLTALKEYNRAVIEAPMLGCEDDTDAETSIDESKTKEENKTNIKECQTVDTTQDKSAETHDDQNPSGINVSDNLNTLNQNVNISNGNFDGTDKHGVHTATTDKADESCQKDVVKTPENETKVGATDVHSSENEPVAKNELALALGNRSAALLHLKRYEECLIDVQLALDFQYPQDMQHKLYERRAKCYMELNKHKDALQAFEDAKSAVIKAELKEKITKTLLTSFEKQMEICRQVIERKAASGDQLTQKVSEVISDSKSRADIPDISGNRDSIYQCMSDKVEIKQTNSLGRHVVAKEKIKTGEVLVVEKPFISVLFPDYHKSHCYHCFVPVTIPIPCTHCTTLVFCSSTCRDKSWTTFHQYECPYFAILDQGMCGRIGHLALRLAIMVGCDEMVKQSRIVQKVDVKSSGQGPESNESYRGDYSEIYHRLVNHSNNRNTEQSFHLTIVSCFLVKVLTLSGYPIPFSVDSQEFIQVGSALLQHLQLIQCNAWPIIELSKPDKFDDMKPVELGIGLYPTAAFVNHSCDPNSDLIFYDNVLTLRAIRNINHLEEITISYGPIFFETKLTIRQKQLKKSHTFNCRCTACEEAWPILQEMFEAPSYLCTECGSLLDTGERIENKYFKCFKCPHKQDMEEVVGLLQNSFDTFAEGMTESLAGRSEEALPKFIQHQLLLQRYLRHPWRDLAACHSAVRNCYRLQGNIAQ